MICELELMCKDYNFDKINALEIISKIDVNEEFVPNECWFKSIILDRAAEWANIEMVKLLLENGADPNKIFNLEETPLWNLQYPGESAVENESRLAIAQLLLEYGANPNINPDNGPEDLFQYVLFSIFNDGYSFLWEYRSRFFILLVAYGGKTDYCVPEIIESFDKDNMKQYRFYREQQKDGLYSGVICDNESNVIAYI